jgi:hypothetical protein
MKRKLKKKIDLNGRFNPKFDGTLKLAAFRDRMHGSHTTEAELDLFDYMALC